MSQRVLDQAGNPLLADWFEKSDEKQVIMSLQFTTLVVIGEVLNDDGIMS
jgi:hypothetical protein